MEKASFCGITFYIGETIPPLEFYGPVYMPSTCRNCAENHGDTYRMICEPSGGDGVVSFSKQEQRVKNMLLDRGNKCFEFQEIVEKTLGYRPCPHWIELVGLQFDIDLKFTL